MGVTGTLAQKGLPHNITVNVVGPTTSSRVVADVKSQLLGPQREAMNNSFSGESIASESTQPDVGLSRTEERRKASEREVQLPRLLINEVFPVPAFRPAIY